MNTIQKRFLLFLIGCIGARSLFVIIAKNISLNYLISVLHSDSYKLMI